LTKTTHFFHITNAFKRHRFQKAFENKGLAGMGDPPTRHH
jgi:hypothetical protein